MASNLGDTLVFNVQFGNTYTFTRKEILDYSARVSSGFKVEPNDLGYPKMSKNFPKSFTRDIKLDVELEGNNASDFNYELRSYIDNYRKTNSKISLTLKDFITPVSALEPIIPAGVDPTGFSPETPGLVFRQYNLILTSWSSISIGLSTVQFFLTFKGY